MHQSRNEETRPSGPPAYPGAPRWVKISAAIATALLLLVVIVMVAGIGGRHGPDRHRPAVEAGEQPEQQAR